MSEPRLILADAGNVRVVYEKEHRVHEVGKLFDRPAHEVHPMLYQHELFRAFERGKASWDAYAQHVELALCRDRRPPPEWNWELFAGIWVEALTEPILPVIEILEALAKHMPVVSASNTDVVSYASVCVRHPRAKNMLAVHSDSMIIGRRKGDPDYFETLLAYVNAELGSDIRPEECVFIDDVVDYIVDAKKKGMQAVWFSEVTEANVLQLKVDLLACGIPEAWLS